MPNRIQRRAVCGTLAGMLFVVWFMNAMHPLGLQADDLLKRKPLPKFLRSKLLADRYLSTRGVDEVMQFERTDAVCEQLVKRPHVPPHARAEALSKLATLRRSNPVAELLPWVTHWDQQPPPTRASAVRAPAKGDALAELCELLTDQPLASLKQHRRQLLELAKTGMRGETRTAAMICLIAVDKTPSTAWDLAEHDSLRLLDLVNGLEWLPNDAPREALYDRLVPLMSATQPVSIRKAAIREIGSLDIRPRETFDILADFVARGVHPDECVASICNISKQHWTGERRQPLADALLRHFAERPLSERSTTGAKQTLKLVRTLAEIVPSEQAEELINRLEALAVHEITIATVKEQMSYDQTVIVIRAGRGVRLRLRNDDIMPHNLVVVNSPDAREAVGMAADRMQNDRDALAKGYVPESDAVWHATSMIQPGHTDAVSFMAPQQTGVYAYLCTFPGHWSKMYGALLVVDDVDSYLAANTPLPTADDLLGIRTVDWTYDQLAAHLPAFNRRRSFANGQQNFLKASCFACHTMRDQGGRVGPDLSKIHEKHKTAAELLTHIMKPSEKVEEKYATAIVETLDGTLIQGVIINETADEIQLSENPLDTCTIKSIAKDSIERISRSRLSPMPEGLLKTLVTPEDVLDLLAYVMAAGDKQHEIFD